MQVQSTNNKVYTISSRSRGTYTLRSNQSNLVDFAYRSRGEVQRLVRKLVRAAKHIRMEYYTYDHIMCLRNMLGDTLPMRAPLWTMQFTLVDDERRHTVYAEYSDAGWQVEVWRTTWDGQPDGKITKQDKVCAFNHVFHTVDEVIDTLETLYPESLECESRCYAHLLEHRPAAYFAHCTVLKTRVVEEELMHVPWYPSRFKDWCLSDQERKDLEITWTSREPGA